MHIIRLSLLLLILACLGLPTHAQEAISYQNRTVQSFFPQGITAELEVTTPARIVTATMYVTMDGSTIYSSPADIPIHRGGQLILLRSHWDGLSSSGDPCPPWANLQQWWVLIDETGNAISTAPVKITYQDNRRAWQAANGSIVTVYTYNQLPAFSTNAVRIGDEALVWLRQAYGYDLPFRPIFVFYNSRTDGAFDLGRAGWSPFDYHVGGVSYPGTNTVIALAETDPAFIERVIPHELAHLYQFQMGARLFDAPMWWIEGDARAQESSTSRTQVIANVKKWSAIQQLPYLPNWQPAPQTAAEIEYVMDVGASFVLFLNETYGGHAAFYALWRVNDDFYQTFAATYGESLPMLDLRWRAWLMRQ